MARRTERMAEPWFMGIEIGGTKLQLGVGRGRGEIVALRRFAVDPARGARGIRMQIVVAFADLVNEARLDREAIAAVGVGFGGPVDTTRGRIERSFQIEGWEDFPLADWMREELGVPAVVIHNDADSAGLAESRFGAGQGYSPLLYVTVGSGIGGALIIDDRIYRGFGKGAGEIGHLQVPVDKVPDGRMMELEQVASGWAIARAAKEIIAAGEATDDADGRLILEQAAGDPGRITGSTVAQAAGNGDPAAISILARARHAIAFALVQAIALVAPSRIVIGGGVSLIGEELWFTPIRRLVAARVFPPFRGVDVVPAALGEEVVVHGALALARDAFGIHTLI
jgi:glucokinase